MLYTIILLTNPGLNTPQCSKISWRDAAGPRKVANKYTKIGCLFCTSGVSDQMRQQNLRSLSCPDHVLTLCSDISFSPTALYTWKPLPIKHPWLKLLSWTFLALLRFAQILSSGVNPKSSKLFRRTCQNNATQCHGAPNCAFRINRRTMLDFDIFDYNIRNCSSN